MDEIFLENSFSIDSIPFLSSKQVVSVMLSPFEIMVRLTSCCLPFQMLAIKNVILWLLEHFTSVDSIGSLTYVVSAICLTWLAWKEHNSCIFKDIGRSLDHLKSLFVPCLRLWAVSDLGVLHIVLPFFSFTILLAFLFDTY